MEHKNSGATTLAARISANGPGIGQERRPVFTRGRPTSYRLAIAAAAGLAAVTLAGCTTAAAASPHQASHLVRADRSCKAEPTWPVIKLTDGSKQPALTVRAGSRVVVMVPRWGWGKATDVHVISPGILREKCTVLLPDHGRRTIFVAVGQGRTLLSATVAPPSDLMMPAWGGVVSVRPAR
jgi:hypothetical protein